MSVLDNRKVLDPKPQGTVFLVGAGPGDPDLLTVKAARLIASASIIFHDELVTPGILSLAKRDTQIVAVGKKAGGQSVPQVQINHRLAEAARSHEAVIRLKGGDPFIFGRGGEELEYLRERGIAVEAVPGITAALGCAAEAGLPLTYRNEALRLTLLTAHTASDAALSDYAGLARQDTTLAIYMGRESAGAIAKGLIAAGRSPSTPAAVLVNGTRKDSRAYTGALKDLAKLAAHAGKSPAMIMIGETVRHSAPWREALARLDMEAGAA
jgi:uroporphyrin-III C-methyltransferase/precorrin-2 dehydrogenase/sirohydrochlorin ferrochelatase